MADEERQEDNMEVDGDGAVSGDEVLNAPIVFNAADYGPIDIPEMVQSVATYAADGPRLMITQIVNENFKSYAGVQKLGPFNKNFTAIIGPNGSGKSNVIDSMLFVFGYRANKIRSKKLSVLIHNSEKHTNVGSCSVAVHFQRIIDTGPGNDEYEVVPNSQLVVSRTAYKDNSSSYYMDGKKAAYKEVAKVLRGCGIDLDHNRFLILQGEVEQIAMMKPKALTEHEDGMLEFLEDIIGSNRFKVPIETLSKRVETLNDLRAEKLNRVKAVEKEMESLEGPKNEAIEFLTLENEMVRLRSKLFQKYIKECTDTEVKAQAEYDKVKESRKSFDDKLEEIKDAKKAKVKEHGKVKREFDRLAKACEESKEKFTEIENQDAAIREDVKLNKAKLKKLEKSLEAEGAKIEELKLVPEQAAQACQEMHKKLAALEKAKQKEEDNEKEVMDSLQGETKELQSEKDSKEAKLLEQQGELNEKRARLQVAEEELEIYTSRQSKETERLEACRKSLKEAADSQAKREEDVKKTSTYIPQLEGEITSAKTELKEVVNSETQCEAKRNSLRNKVEEARSSMQASKSQNRVLSALMEEKAKGRLPGIHGRLGDLGAIDPRYDVAISTACGFLDHVVVDTSDTGKSCIEFLKKNSVGRVNIICLDKMEKFRAETKRKITTPENVPRLFDLVRAKEELVRTAFYFALRDCLVAKDIEQGTRVAYGKTRYRVVTLKGEVVEISGAMSGGGNTVIKGKMGSQLVADVDPRELANMENQLGQLNQELETLRLRKVKLEEGFGQKEKDLTQLRHNQQKHTQEIAGLKERLAALRKQEKEQEQVLKSVVPDPKKLKELEGNVGSFRKDYDKVAQAAAKLEGQVKELHEQIMEIGGAKLSAVQSRLKTVNNDIDKVTGQITKNSVGVKTAERNLKRAEDKVRTVTEEIAETTKNIESLKEKLQNMEGEGTRLLEVHEKAQTDVKERETVLLGLQAEMENIETEEAEMAKNGVELQHELEKVDSVLKENKAKLKHWRKEAAGLSLSAITREEGEELTLPELSPEELTELVIQELKLAITVQEEKLAQMKPNMAAIAEFRKKEEVYLQRVKELDEITGVRDSQRQYHDSLRKQRLEEFMAGFQVITNKLKEMYQMITLGGDAELELVDSLDPFSEGIVFSVRPPKKSWKNISNLSGGEKTLSSLALVFALHHYKPTPLYVMDEIDAALDFKNVSIVANYIKERTKNAQFIIISLRNNMFELADRLVGIYKTHDCTKSVALNPWKLSEGFSNRIREVHNIELND